MTKPQNLPTVLQKKTLLIGVQAPYNPTMNIESYYEEFINLAKSNHISYDDIRFVKLRSIDPAYFFTRGKLDELLEFIQTHQFDIIVISEPLSAMQARNLSDIFNADIIDRTELILKIFELNALSAEGKLQVQIALLEHEKSRLAGIGKELEQQEGAVGLRGGPGETAKEREKRYLNRFIQKLKKNLEKIQKNREQQRKQRIKTGLPIISLVGYTNAGKSTILNTLTQSSVLAEDRPFATLDTTTRELYIDGQKKGLLTDTVGFIQLLPHHLIEAFKSTLSELQYADLLLHVVDITDPNWQTHIDMVLSILDELEVNKPMLYVFNKVDKLKSEELPKNIHQFQPQVIVSATSKKELQPLIDYLSAWGK